MSDDLLEALLRAALADGALDAESLPRFAEALRARAALVLADRVQPIEERAAAFATESAWRAGVMAGFDEEKKTWQEAHARLARDREAQVSEVLGLQQERAALLEQQQRSTEEREALIEQHRRAMEEREALIDQDRRRVEECRSARAEVEALHAQASADRLAREREITGLQADVQTLRAEAKALKAEMEAGRREKDVASAVHDRLLAHHRATLAHVAETLRGLARDLPWRYRRARAAALELLRLLEKDTP
jgi:chromosome segregation ATPase